MRGRVSLRSALKIEAMKVAFDDRAIADLNNIYRFIAENSSVSAKMIVERLVSDIDRLAEFPRMGRTARVPGVREWGVPRLPYVIVYEIDELISVLTVTAVFHTARRR